VDLVGSLDALDTDPRRGTASQPLKNRRLQKSAARAIFFYPCATFQSSRCVFDCHKR
jgi:hypothetical protein